MSDSAFRYPTLTLSNSFAVGNVHLSVVYEER